MRLLELAHRFLNKKSTRARKSRLRSAAIERLEDRVVLFVASGNAWPSPEVVTISFMPDGTDYGGIASNLNSTFDNNPNLQGLWKAEILRAAQSWSAVTNLNFVVVEDSGAAWGTGAYQQGDPTFGDIRIGGINFGSSLASAMAPPPVNNYSVAGDIYFNTGMSFGISGYGGYDLFTVAAHEIGHTLGLNHSTVSASQMYSVYNGVKSTLNADDISGIRSIYSNGGVRSADGYETASGNNNINDAKNISGDLIRSKKWAIIDGLDITTTSDVDFYKVNMTAWADSNLVIKVQSSGFSQLSPKLTVYDKDKTTVLGTVSGAGQHGTSISLTIPGVTGTDIFYLKVEAAESTVFGVGAYGITLDLGASTPPVLTPPDTMLANGSPLQSGGGQALNDDHGYRAEGDSPIAIAPEEPTIDQGTGASASRVLSGLAENNSLITVYDNGIELGTTISDDSGKWSFSLVGKLSVGSHSLTATVTSGAGVVSPYSAAKTVNVSYRRRGGASNR